MRTEFVGRERECAVLGNWLAAALAGRPRVVLCRGEPGIGKTRLAEQLASEAGIEGVSAVWGLASESAGAPPFWPWRQVLRAVGRVVDLAAIADEHRLTADLSRLAPKLFAGPGSVSDGGGSPEDRFRIFDAVERLLRGVTGDHPLLIIFDDAHWSDHSSLLLLHHVARSMHGQRLMFVVNFRDTEALHGVLVTELPREQVTRELEIHGLPVAAVGAQLASFGGGRMTDSDVERVHAWTGGNPHFVGEIGKALADRPELASGVPVTVSVQTATGDRLNRLSPSAVRLLQAASIVGRDFSLAVVAPMVGSPVLDCLAWLDEAVTARLVEPTSTPGEHRFVHDLVRDAVEAGLGTPGRVRLHRLAAEVVEEVHAGRLEPHLSDIARHWAIAAAAGQRALAAGWIQRAAEEAMRRLAYEDAVGLYRLALTVGADEVDDVGRCRLLLAVATALRLAGEYAGRLESCREAAALARGLGLRRPDLLAEAALTLEGGESGLESELTVRRLCEEVLGALDPEPTALRARVTAHLATSCMYLGDIDAAGPASRQALAAANECGDQDAVTAALRARQLVCSGPDGVDERARLAERMFAIGRERRDPATQMWAHLWRIDVAFQRGDLPAAAQELELLSRCAQEVRGPVARWHLLQCRAVLAQAQARFADGRRLADQALAALPPSATGHGSAIINRTGLLFTIGRHTGDGGDVIGLHGASAPDDGPDRELELPTAGVIFSVAAAYMLATEGSLPQAETVYRRLGPPAGWLPIPHARTVCYAFGIGTAIALDGPADVATLRDLLAPYRGQHVVSGAGCVAYNGPVDLYLGTAAHHLRLLDDAVADLEAAARACASNGAAGYHAEARYELAAALARRARPGDLPRARALSADVAKQAEALGMQPWADRALRLLEQLDRRGDPLTRREREVATLVAKGLTNREIAGRLSMSERTAQNHVQHVLTKLGLANRSQIAVWVTQRT